MKLVALRTNSIDSFRDPSSYGCHGQWGDCSQLLNPAVETEQLLHGVSGRVVLLNLWGLPASGFCLEKNQLPKAESSIRNGEGSSGFGWRKAGAVPTRRLNPGDSLAQLKAVLPAGI